MAMIRMGVSAADLGLQERSLNYQMREIALLHAVEKYKQFYAE